MESKSSSQLSKTMLYGLILGIVLIIYSYVLHITKQEKNFLLGLLHYIFLIVAIYVSIQCYRNRCCNGYISYGKAFGTGVLTVLWASILLAIYVYVLTKYIDLSILENARNAAMEKLENSGNSEQADKMAGLMDIFVSSGFMATMSLLGNMLLGTILSLIIAAILKKEKNIFDEPEVLDQEIN